MFLLVSHHQGNGLRRCLAQLTRRDNFICCLMNRLSGLMCHLPLSRQRLWCVYSCAYSTQYTACSLCVIGSRLQRLPAWWVFNCYILILIHCLRNRLHLLSRRRGHRSQLYHIRRDLLYTNLVWVRRFAQSIVFVWLYVREPRRFRISL